MDRRDFLKSTGGIAAAATTAGMARADAPAAPHLPQGAKTLRMAMTWPDDGRGFGDSGRRLARRIEAATGGRYRIEIAETPKSPADAIASGDADLVHGTEDAHVALNPAFGYFAGLPSERALPIRDLETWLLIGGGQPLWDDLSAGYGVKPLLAGHSGPETLWSARPLGTLGDFAGARIACTGLAAGVLRGIGAEPVVLAPAEIRSALETGALTAAVYGGLIAAMSLGLPEAAPIALSAPALSRGTALSLAVDLRLWRDLPESDRAAFASAAAEELRVTISESVALREPIAIALRERLGVEARDVGSEIREAMQRVGSAVVAHAAAFDAKAARINASYMAFSSALGGAAQPVA